MADITTIARPYAKAIFELALAEKKLSNWSGVLAILAQAIVHPQVIAFIRNPSVNADAQRELLLSLVVQTDLVHQPLIESFLALLAKNKRLVLLPQIYAQFEALRAQQEKTLVVNVDSYAPLTAQQQQRLIETLGQRLQRQVSLDINIDESLLGGAMIQAGDIVIDGSVRGQLLKLANNLAA